jgi:hypothetical protein
MFQEKRGRGCLGVSRDWPDCTVTPPCFSTSATTFASFSILVIPSSPYIRHRSVLAYDHHFRPGMMLYSVDYIFYPGDRLIRAFRGRLQLKRPSLIRVGRYNHTFCFLESRGVGHAVIAGSNPATAFLQILTGITIDVMQPFCQD